MSQNEQFIPKAIFGDIEQLRSREIPSQILPTFHADYQQATDFLLSYQKNPETFKSYRREIERFCHWSWHFAKLTFSQLSREDLESYLQFCRKPPNHWIGTKNVARFKKAEGRLIPNPEWRPYVARVSKAERTLGKKPSANHYTLSDDGFKVIFAVLQGFFKHMVLADYLPVNIVDLIKQKTTYYRKQQGRAKVRRIAPMQWDVVMETAENMARENPEKHERTLFIISLLYGLYLRVSELAASDRWMPQMCHFEKDYEDNWWFRTLGKGNKERTIAVSNSVLKALARWRKYLGAMTDLPTPTDNLPLVCSQSQDRPISSTRQIRNIVQSCFDAAVQKLEQEEHKHQAAELREATVHWLRHTGISDDVKFRPREHVRDDAGHSSSMITDRYIDIDSRERHQSAKDKQLTN